MQLVALAVGPAFLVLHVFYSIDRQREPWANVLRYCALGGLLVFAAGSLEDILIRAAGGLLERGLLGSTLKAVVFVALVEEGCKLLPLALLGGRDRHLDEPFDWVVYSVASALGFAAVENLFYVADGGAGTALARAFTAVPAHALDGTLMGYHLALASRAHGRERARRRILALLEPTLWHGAYDGLLFAAQDASAAGAGAGGWIALWFALVFLQWGVCARRIAQARQLVPLRPPPVLYPLRATHWMRRGTRTRS